MRLTLRSAILGVALIATAPAHAQLAPPAPPAGLFDFVVQTNCFYIAEQEDLRTPYWAWETVPLFGPGTARLVARTVNDPDLVHFFSSNPAVLQPPAQMQLTGAIGGIPYQQTEGSVTVQDILQQPMTVTITAQSTYMVTRFFDTVSGRPARERTFRVYPRMSLAGASVAPQKMTYRPGDNVTVTAQLPFAAELSMVRVRFEQPRFVVGGTTHRAGYPELGGGSGGRVLDQQPGSDSAQVSFEFRWPDHPSLADYAAQHLELRMNVALESASTACDLVKDPSARELIFQLSNPNWQLPQRAPELQTGPFQLQRRF